jgi:hypothetical protein
LNKLQVYGIAIVWILPYQVFGYLEILGAGLNRPLRTSAGNGGTAPPGLDGKPKQVLSRVGWVPDRAMEDSPTFSALQMALSRRIVEPELVHHSDGGSQYASPDHTNLLKENGRVNARRCCQPRV